MQGRGRARTAGLFGEHSMRACIGANNTSIETTVQMKLNNVCSVGLDILRGNAFEVVIDEWIYELVFRVLTLGVTFLKKSCASSAKSIDEFLDVVQDTFREFENGSTFSPQYLQNHTQFQEMKRICGSNLMWRAESLIHMMQTPTSTTSH